MIKNIKSYFSLEFQYHAFVDVVSGNDVCVYVDCYGDLYMKDSRWAFFSVYKGNLSD